MEWAEAEKEEITEDDVAGLEWEKASEANGRLYDLLIMMCSGDALVLVEHHKRSRIRSVAGAIKEV